MKRDIIVKYSIVLLVIGCVFSCRKMDSTYKEFLVPGGVTYPQKAKTPIIYAGKNRVKIIWFGGADPSVVFARIFWNNYADSVEIDIPPGEDTVSVFIENLPERVYSFIIKTYDEQGHVSVPVEVIGKTYGEKYQSSLLATPLNASGMNNAGVAMFYWGIPDITNGAFAYEIRYKNNEENTVVKYLPIEDSISTITDKDLKAGTKVSYRTVFVPDSMSIDTFYSDFATVTIKNINIELDKSKWELHPLDNDINPLGYSDRPISRLWDNSTSTKPCRIVGDNLPQWITIDLGQEVVLTRVKMSFYSGPEINIANLYWLGIPKKFEIWGSNDPGEDGDWTDWTLLGHFIGETPSGEPRGSLTDEDIIAGKEGLDFSFPQQESAYRYIRLKTINTWLNPSLPSRTDVWYSEMTLWGQP